MSGSVLPCRPVRDKWARNSSLGAHHSRDAPRIEVATCLAAYCAYLSPMVCATHLRWTLPHTCTENQLDLPSVRMRSSQQFSVVTFIFQVSPVLSSCVALVPMVLILSGRDAGSRGGCNMLEARGFGIYRGMLLKHLVVRDFLVTIRLDMLGGGGQGEVDIKLQRAS